MTEVDKNDSMVGVQPTSMEAYNFEIEDGETWETGFDEIFVVLMTQEESTVGAGTYGGYTTSGGQITFKVDSKKTWAVLVIGRR